jgi:DNA polymerase III subunit delta'
MLFSSIPGLEEVKQKIIQAVKNNHLAHALLFHGPEGSPNLSMALSLATYLHCQQPQEADACGTCPSCQKMEKLVHPDTNYAIPVPGDSKEKEDEKEDVKKVDYVASFRSFAINTPYGNPTDWVHHNNIEKKQLNISKYAAKQIIKTLSLKSFEGGYKIMLIWAPEFMNVQSANALLKIIEEPPANTYFLLVTSQPEQLLTTIMSRTQKIMVRRFTDLEVKTHLVQEGFCSASTAEQIAPLADGNMRRAYQLVDEVVDENTHLIRDWYRNCFTCNVTQILEDVEQFAGKDKETQKSLLLTGLNVLREVLLDKSQLTVLMRSVDEDRGFIHNLGSKVLNEAKIFSMYQMINSSFYHLERNANAKILFTDLSFKLYRIMRA